MSKNTSKHSDTLVPSNFQKFLKTLYLGRDYRYYNVIDSTNKEVKRLISKGHNIKNGSVFICETQTNGYGKFNRKWHSPEKSGLWFTIVLNIEDADIDITKITLLTGASVCQSLRSFNIDSYIKWPNDIYINNKKIGGILTERMWCSQERSYLIIGIGLNINSTEDSFPKELKDYATSISIETGKNFSRAEILCSILSCFENFLDDLKRSANYDKILELNRKYSNILGKKIKILNPDGSTYETEALALSDNGSLVIRDNLGKRKELISGEVSIRCSYNAC